MKKLASCGFTADDFQLLVSDMLFRNKSVMDALTKYQQTNASVCNSIAKAATTCGCIKINTSKQDYSKGNTLYEMANLSKTHIEGKLCDKCAEHLEKEMGSNLFYLTSLCSIFDINLYDIILKESKRIETLGYYTLR
ncbi:MAG TPA: DUF1573 domain-containing protein [Clostridiales bacterium]|nr:DUF1573 domain-containing protein [Clostridiales bacterium]